MRPSTGESARSGEVLVKFRRQLASFERGQLEQQTDADQNRVVGSIGVRRMHSRRYDTQTLLAFLRTHPDVAYVEPNYIVEADAAPNDPSFFQLWGLRNTGQTVGVPGTPGADIEATLAWDISTGSTNTVVAVIDTGVNYNHPDLAANVWSAPAPFTVTIGGQTITLRRRHAWLQRALRTPAIPRTTTATARTSPARSAPSATTTSAWRG